MGVSTVTRAHAGAGVSAGRAASRCPSSWAPSGRTAALPVPEGLRQELVSPSAPTPPVVCSAPSLDQTPLVPWSLGPLVSRREEAARQGRGQALRRVREPCSDNGSDFSRRNSGTRCGAHTLSCVHVGVPLGGSDLVPGALGPPRGHRAAHAATALTGVCGSRRSRLRPCSALRAAP